MLDPFEIGARNLDVLRQELTAYKLPRRIVFLEAIPRTERGKIDRAALLRRAGDPDASDLRR